MGRFILVACLVLIAVGCLEACFAPPMEWGRPCYSTKVHWGADPYATIHYKIKVRGLVSNTKGMKYVCCRAMGCGPKGGNCLHTHLRFYDIGCAYTSISTSLPWGVNEYTPAVRCKTVPFGTFVAWKF